MRIAVAQINTTTGDIGQNLERVLSGVRRACEEGVDLLALPEFALSGWEPLDLGRDPDFVGAHRAALDCVRATAEVPVVIGATDYAEGSYERTALLLADGAVRAAAPAEAAAERGLTEQAQVAGWPVTVSVGRPPHGEETDALTVCLSAMPFYGGCLDTREECWRAAARRRGAPMVVVNMVGGYGTTVFDGASFAIDGQGRKLAEAAHFAEDFLVVDTESGSDGEPDAGWERRETQRETDTGDTPRLYEALRLGLADFVRKSDFEQVVFGLSGGIDSAVVAALAADALGPSAVNALGMPTTFSSRRTRHDAQVVAKNLGVDYHVVPIEKLRGQYEAALAPLFAGTATGVAEENIQARIRGTLVMAYANKFGAMPLATGNRSEIAMGYCTLYGDTVGGLAVIGDIPKTTVYSLAEHANRHGERIPRSAIEAPPSAELRPGQTDQDALPPYGMLDDVLVLYLDEGLHVSQIVARGFEEERVREVVRRVKAADFKRRQLPPVLRVYRPHFRWPRMPLAARLARHHEREFGGSDG